MKIATKTVRKADKNPPFSGLDGFGYEIAG
jgi:hypothetical protein